MMHETITAVAPAGACFTVDRAALLPALDYMARRIVERRNTIPILSNLVIEATGDGVAIITATDLDVEAALTVPADVETPGVWCVDAYAVRDVVKKLAKGAAVTFDHPGLAGSVGLSSGRARHTLRTLPRDDMPTVRTQRPVAAFELESPELADDLARVIQERNAAQSIVTQRGERIATLEGTTQAVAGQLEHMAERALRAENALRAAEQRLRRRGMPYIMPRPAVRFVGAIAA